MKYKTMFILLCVIWFFSYLAGAIVENKNAKEVCKVQSTYIINGTTYLCEGKL